MYFYLNNGGFNFDEFYNRMCYDVFLMVFDCYFFGLLIFLWKLFCFNIFDDFYLIVRIRKYDLICI